MLTMVAAHAGGMQGIRGRRGQQSNRFATFRSLTHKPSFSRLTVPKLRRATTSLVCMQCAVLGVLDPAVGKTFDKLWHASVSRTNTANLTPCRMQDAALSTPYKISVSK